MLDAQYLFVSLILNSIGFRVIFKNTNFKIGIKPIYKHYIIF